MERKNAYFTVEAAMVLPIVIGAVILFVFLFIFQYDRCLMEQDVNYLTICGAAADEDSLQEELKKRINSLDMEKYFVWESSKLNVTVERDTVSAEGEGSLTMPLPQWNFFHENNMWVAQACRKSRRVSPTSFVRLFRKMRGGV